MDDGNFRDDEVSRQATSEDDGVRDAVTWQDKSTFSMALPEVYARFVEAGLGRSLRTLQRFCERGHLRAAKYPTETGAVWYVDPESVETKIEEIRQVQEARGRPATPSDDTPAATANDMSQPDADRRRVSSLENCDDRRDTATASSDDEQRQPNGDVARRASKDNTPEPGGTERQTATDGDDKYVTVPVVILDALTGQLAAKDEQIKRRDAQLERLVESHDKDRQLLGAALAIIHKEDFPLELGEGDEPGVDTDPEPAEEIKPEAVHGGDYPQPAQPIGGV